MQICKKQHKWVLYQIVMTCIFVMAGCFHVMAATMEKQVVAISVSDFTGTAEQLRICSDENIHDDNGNVLLQKDAMMDIAFSEEGDTYRASAELYRGVRYYISDGIRQIPFEVSGQTVDVSFKEDVGEDNTETQEIITEDTSTEGKLGIGTKIPQTANIGDTMKCVVNVLSGAVEETSDTFLLQCEIPEGMELESVYTGTYTDDVELQLLCKTENDNKWHSWGEGIRSSKGETFETSDINFAEGDRISAFAISAETVPEGFALNEEDPCYYYVKVKDKNSASGYSGISKVSAYIGSQKTSSQSAFNTILQTEVQTGDENIIFIGSFILMLVAVFVLISYIIVRIVLYKKEESIQKTDLPVKFNNYEGGEAAEKMSSLLGKKPG